MKGYSFRMNTHVLADNVEDARKKYRKIMHIADHIPDEFIEEIKDDD